MAEASGQEREELVPVPAALVLHRHHHHRTPRA
jgi:hypothetical protein